MNSQRDIDIPQATSRATQAATAVVRNTLWNIVGASLPLVSAVVTLPVLIRSIGSERLRVLAIAWVILNYLDLFGLGPAYTIARAFHNPSDPLTLAGAL